MKAINLMAILIALLFVTQSCKDDDDADACAGLSPVSAAFSTSYEMGWQDSTRRFQADTLINQYETIFTAEQENATYKWRVGSDPRIFDEREFTLTFGGTEGLIDIQLIVEANPDLDCFPDDDGRDTLNRQIYFVEVADSQLWGKYRGSVSSAPNDIFDIDVVQLLPPFSGDYKVNNLPKGCSMMEGFSQIFIRPAYRNFVMPRLGNYADCPKPQGWGMLDYGNNLTIEYTIWNPLIQELQSDSFIGKKIN